MTWNGGIEYSPDAGAAPAPLTGVTINNSSGEIWAAYASAWQSWTPTVTNIDPGNGSHTCKYLSIGGRAHIIYRLTLGSTSVIATDPWLGFTEFAGNWDTSSIAGDAACYDTSGARWYPAVVTRAATVDTIAIKVTATTPFTWTTGDILSVSFSAGKSMPTSTIGE